MTEGARGPASTGSDSPGPILRCGHPREERIGAKAVTRSSQEKRGSRGPPGPGTVRGTNSQAGDPLSRVHHAGVSGRLGPASPAANPGPYLPVLQVLHGHEQAAGDVEELPAQTVWGTNTGRSRSGRRPGAQADVPTGSPSPARLLTQILGPSGIWGPWWSLRTTWDMSHQLCPQVLWVPALTAWFVTVAGRSALRAWLKCGSSLSRRGRAGEHLLAGHLPTQENTPRCRKGGRRLRGRCYQEEHGHAELVSACGASRAEAMPRSRMTGSPLIWFLKCCGRCWGQGSASPAL